MNHNVHQSLQQMLVPVTDLAPDPKNRRVHDERNLKAIQDSIAAHGQRKPVVVQLRSDAGQDMVVRAGNGTVEACRRLGWTHVAALVVDETDKDAVAFALRDNRSAELAEWDLRGLGEDLRFLRDEGMVLEDVGWEAYEAEPLMVAEWAPAAVSDEEFAVPERRVGLMFTKSQYDRLRDLLGGKPTADEIVRSIEDHKSKDKGKN